MRKKILAFTSAFVLAPAVLFAGAAPVAAHGDPAHTSCAGGIVQLVGDEKMIPSGPGEGPSGTFIAEQFATQGIAALIVAIAHDPDSGACEAGP